MTAHYQSNVLFRGGFVAVALLSAVVIAVAVHPGSRLGTVVLAQQPLRWIGERSYGIYLWHWPVFMLTRPGQDVALTGGANLALRLGLTVVIAELSYRFVEEPIRHGALGRWFAGLRSARGPERTLMWQRTLGMSTVVIVAIALTGVGLASAQPPGSTTPCGSSRRPKPRPPRDRSAPGRTTPSTEATAAAAGHRHRRFGDARRERALEAKIPGIHVDAVKSRQMGNAIDIIRAAKAAGQLSPVVVIHLGTNGTIIDGHMEALNSLLADRQQVVFLNL